MRLLYRFAIGIKERELQRWLAGDMERQEAVNLQRGPYDNLSVTELKDRIKAHPHGGLHPRFAGKEQLINILTHLDQQAKDTAGQSAGMNVEKVLLNFQRSTFIQLKILLIALFLQRTVSMTSWTRRSLKLKK